MTHNYGYNQACEIQVDASTTLFGLKKKLVTKLFDEKNPVSEQDKHGESKLHS